MRRICSMASSSMTFAKLIAVLNFPTISKDSIAVKTSVFCSWHPLAKKLQMQC